MCKTLFENWTLQCWMHFLITSLDGSILWRVCENFLFTFERMREFFCCSNLDICLVSHDWFIFIVGENVLKCLILHFFVYIYCISIKIGTILKPKWWFFTRKYSKYFLTLKLRILARIFKFSWKSIFGHSNWIFAAVCFVITKCFSKINLIFKAFLVINAI